MCGSATTVHSASLTAPSILFRVNVSLTIFLLAIDRVAPIGLKTDREVHDLIVLACPSPTIVKANLRR